MAWRASAAGSSSALTISSEREARRGAAACGRPPQSRRGRAEGEEAGTRSKAKRERRQRQRQGRKETDIEMRWTAACQKSKRTVGVSI